MTEAPHTTIYRKDYLPYDYLIESADLRFELGEEITLVTAALAVRVRDGRQAEHAPLILYGRRFQLLEILLDGVPLQQEKYTVTPEQLTIQDVPSSFTLQIKTALRPQDNTFLEGLYRSGGMFCTQCEAEGFRSITYYPDRPDVLTIFTTTIIADRQLYPVLLSNGNLVQQGEMPDGRHFATWHDPFRKPSYLFALVAGDLIDIRDSFTTCSGRPVDLRIYVHRHNRDKCGHAMLSLKNAMRWDEQTFGREYDLERYMIVAVDDFNMGAMENKGLNIFNSRYVLASPATATDDDYNAIEAVIGHEYFHNWSGNRVTCRDWFQLSLKEGFTVFRDQEFSSDMQSRGVKRIADVRNLRTAQFAEDAGPLAHPVRPDSYMEINNFYTMTVYEKGAEVVRMLHTLLGAEKFRKGSDLYFSRHDGQAVQVDDFLRAMAEAGGIDLQQFGLWYSQAGTPEIIASGAYDPSSTTFTLTLRQSCRPTPGQPFKEPLHIPLAMGLLAQDGRPLALLSEDGSEYASDTAVLELRSSEQSFRFRNVTEEPLPALLRGFSAPVKLDYPYRHDQLTVLMAHEKDPFCRWEAGQRLASSIILELVSAYQQGQKLVLNNDFAQAYGITLSVATDDHAFLAEALTLPSEKYIAEQSAVIDPVAIHAARQFLIRSLAARHKERFLELRAECRSTAPYSPGDGRSGQRRLANLCLAYLASNCEQDIIELCLQQYHSADNMTDQLGAILPLASCACPQRRTVLEDFYRRWQSDRQVVDKWFALQAASTLPGALEEVRELLEHPAFELANPNRFRALVGNFSQVNLVNFHDPSGSGYRFLSDQLIRLIPLNPQVSARLLAPLTGWRRFDEKLGTMMREELERISHLPDLPRDVYEVVSKSLDN